jgi:hypothetical protein
MAASFSSVSLFPFERIAVITSERFDVVKTSGINVRDDQAWACQQTSGAGPVNQFCHAAPRFAGNDRTLVKAKWSVRAGSEEQFMSDFLAYERLESADREFGYVLITNEFDATRPRAACERRRQNAPFFSQVVHISPAAVQVVYREGGAEGATAVRQHIATGRLMSFQAWLESIGAGPGRTARRSRMK